MPVIPDLERHRQAGRSLSLEARLVPKLVRSCHKAVFKLYQRPMEIQGKEGDQSLKRWLTSFQMAMA